MDSVESNSPAGQAGIQKGDILTGIGEYTIRNKLDFYRALLSLKPNEDTAFTFFRNNESMDVAVAVKGVRSGALAHKNVASRPSAVAPKTASKAITNEEWDQLVWDNLGIKYAPIPAQEYEQMYSQFVLVKDANFSDGGILVKGVRSGSPATQAGFITGDIIVGIENWAIASANDIRYIGGQNWTKLQSETNRLRADVIRDSQHFYTDIPTK